MTNTSTICTQDANQARTQQVGKIRCDWDGFPKWLGHPTSVSDQTIWYTSPLLGSWRHHQQQRTWNWPVPTSKTNWATGNPGMRRKVHDIGSVCSISANPTGTIKLPICYSQHIQRAIPLYTVTFWSGICSSPVPEGNGCYFTRNSTLHLLYWRCTAERSKWSRALVKFGWSSSTTSRARNASLAWQLEVSEGLYWLFGSPHRCSELPHD